MLTERLLYSLKLKTHIQNKCCHTQQTSSRTILQGAATWRIEWQNFRAIAHSENFTTIAVAARLVTLASQRRI